MPGLPGKKTLRRLPRKSRGKNCPTSANAPPPPRAALLPSSSSATENSWSASGPPASSTRICGNFRTSNSTAPDAKDAFKSLFGFRTAWLIQPLCTVKHSITRYRITLEAWRALSEGRVSILRPGKTGTTEDKPRAPPKRLAFGKRRRKCSGWPLPPPTKNSPVGPPLVSCPADDLFRP